MTTTQSKKTSTKSSGSSQKSAATKVAGTSKKAASTAKKQSVSKRAASHNGLLAKAKDVVTDLLHTAGEKAIEMVTEKLSANGNKRATGARTVAKTSKPTAKRTTAAEKKPSRPSASTRA